MFPSRRIFTPSNIKAKLGRFVETGEVHRWSERQAARRAAAARDKNRTAAARARPSPQKTLLLLRAKFDAVPLQTPTGVLDLHRLTPADLRVDSPKSAAVFRALVEKTEGRRNVPSRLLLALLGTSPDQIKDPFVVTRDVKKLLARDGDLVRAMHLCRLAGPAATAALNAVIEWNLDRSNTDAAHKCLANAARWRIPTSPHTYVHYFGGLARCHEWGAVPDELVARTVRILDRMETVPHEVFNAALALVAKNFSLRQNSMAELLALAPDRSIAPSAHTYTTYLNGARHFHHLRARAIRADTKLSGPERTAQLFAEHARLVHTANMILARVLAGATPPVPPTRAEADADPSLLPLYRQKCRRVLVDVDPVFAATFLLCFVNNAAGTAGTASNGAHYRYLQQALAYLAAWSPEVGDMLRAAGMEPPFEPSSPVRARTDARFSSAPAAAHLPHQLAAVDPSQANPMVVFPPPASSSNKTRATFSGKTKPLVDFGRPTFADIHKAALHHSHQTSRGRFGRKQTRPIALERRAPVNRFLLQIALDAVVKLGRHAEFYRAMWYALDRWGGFAVAVPQIEKLQCSAIPEEKYPAAFDSAYPVTPKPHDEDAIDIMLVENFIHKMEENFPHTAVPARFAAELVAAVVGRANAARTLAPRDKTFDAVFAILNRDLHLYNDKNWHQGTVGNRRRALPNNTPKRSLSAAQLHDILDPLVTLMRCIMVHESKVYEKVANRKALMLNRFVESYNSLVGKLYAATWLDAPDNSPAALAVHKKILGGGILFYRPKALIDPRDKIVYAENVRESMEFVYKALKESTLLTLPEKRLMHTLKSFFTVDVRAPDAVDKVKGLQRKVYDLCK